MSVEKIKIKDLPSKEYITNSDIFVESDTKNTYKVTADDIANYIADSNHITDKYVKQSSIGVKNGVVPLNSNKKINGTYIQYGTTASTSYEGSAGKILETNLDNHLTDTDAHGYNTKLNSLKGSANGLAELDENGKVPSEQLPSFVDDVLEGKATGISKDETTGAITAIGFILLGESTECTPESGKIYVDVNTNIQYRWSGSIYVTTGSNIALGETSSTAYRGDRGKTAYEHSQSVHAPSNAQANVIEIVKVNGTALTPSSKSVDVVIPTKVSQLTNDSGFKTTDNNTTYSLSKSGSTITLTGSDGSKTSVTDSSGSVGSSVSFTQNLVSGTKVGTLTIDGTDIDLYAPTNTDTHYTTRLKVGASNTATSNAAATNGNVYMNVLDNTTVRDSHKIVGSGATTVTSDANGVITIKSTDSGVKEEITDSEPTNQNIGDHWLFEF